MKKATLLSVIYNLYILSYLLDWLLCKLSAKHSLKPSVKILFKHIALVIQNATVAVTQAMVKAAI